MEKIVYTFEFKVGDRVLVYYRGLLYVATITKRKISDYGEIEYYVHYKGFKRSWDEWVDSDEVLAINEINLAHKERLEFNRKSCTKSRKQRKTKKKSSSKSAKGKRGKPKKSAKQTAGPVQGPASVELKELTVTLTDFLKYHPGSHTTQFTKQATAQSTKRTVEKSAKLDLHIISEPAVTQKRKKISQESLKQDNDSSPKPKKRKRGGRSKKNREQSSGQDSAKIAVSAKVQLAKLAKEKSAETELTVDKSAKSAIQSVTEPATTQLAGPSSIPLPELDVEEIDFQKCADPLFALNTEPGTTEDAFSSKPLKKNRGSPNKNVEQSAGPATQSALEPATAQLAEPTTSQYVEPAVEKFTESATQSALEPATAQLAEPTTSQYVEPAVEKSTKSAIQSALEPATAQLAEPTTSQYVEPAVEKSTESAIQSALEPATAQLAEPTTSQYVENSTESATQSALELATAQLAEPTTSQSIEPAVEESATSVVGESIAIKENKDVTAVENIVINIVPLSKIPITNSPFSVEFFKKLELQPVLKRALEFDRMMHNTFHKVLKFPDDNFVANIIYIFTNSSYFIKDNQKNSSTMFSITLLQYFNYCVNGRLTYLIERRFYLQKKGLEYFRKRMKSRPNINYAFKNDINPKTIWCYLYGPMYLIRLIKALPKIMLSSLWFSEYSMELFVDHMNELSQFLADNFCTFFTNDDYMKPDASI